MDVETRS